MRLRRRAPFTPTAVGTAAQLPLRAQALVPFALALALVVAMSAGGAAFVARSAVDRELEAQAETARHLVSGRVRQTEEWLGREAAEMEGEAGNLRGRALEQRLMAFAVREGLTLAAARDATVTSDGRLAWARLPFAQALLERSRREGKPAVGIGRSRRGEPFVLAGAHGEGGRSWLAGRAIDRALLAEVERPTGVLVRLETLEAAAAPTPDGTRAFEWPLVFTDGSRSRLQVSVATDALRDATFSSLLLVGYAAVTLTREQAPVLTAGRPAEVASDDVAAVARQVGHDVYGIAAQDGTRLEVTSGSRGEVWVRYLTGGAPVGDRRPQHLTVGTYRQAGAFAAAQQAAEGAQTRSAELPGGGVMLWSLDRPTSVYFARPGSDLLVEVYSPDPEQAKGLVRGGAVAPLR